MVVRIVVRVRVRERFIVGVILRESLYVSAGVIVGVKAPAT